MLVGGVVDDEVHDQLHPALVHGREQGVEVRERAERRVDVAVVGDVVAGVVLRRRVDGGEPEHVDAERGEVVEVREDAAQVADPVAVGVREAARPDLVDDGALPPLRHAASRLAAIEAPAQWRAKPGVESTRSPGTIVIAS